MQTVWLFIAELAGKDLDLILIIKFLVYKMPSVIPLVLPLSILLSSIMTFGDLAENYEFAAIKSSGISFQRSLRSLTVFILLLSFVAFLFANNVIPYAEYKFINFRRNIAQVKPAMAIAEGQFSEVGNYTIKVDKKSGKNGSVLTGVTIHQKAANLQGNKSIIKAKSGELISSESSNILKMVLYNGHYYEDIIPKKIEEKERLPFAKADFKKDVINIDLSKLNKSEGDEGEISNTNTMLNVNELRYTLDSLDLNYKKDIVSFAENIYQRTGVTVVNNQVKDSINKVFNYDDVLKNVDKSKISTITNLANGTVENTMFSIESSQIEMKAKQKNINNHWIALYDKFVIAFACILMFFIGAPLGAIIRKGGLGLPIVFAILIFIIFHFVNTFGKKVAQEGGIPTFMGMWMSSFILTPLALLLTYRATNDNGLINFDSITHSIQLFLRRILPFKKKENV